MESARARQQVLLGHLRPEAVGAQRENGGIAAAACMAEPEPQRGQKFNDFDDDVVIVAAYRTALTKARRGGFKDTPADDLLAPVFRAVLERTGVDPAEVGDICVGTVMAPGSWRAMECRMAQFYAGIPDTVPIRTVNRQCSSGLQAIADIAAAIRAGFIEIGIAAGVETMSSNPMSLDRAQVNPRLQQFKQAQDCLLPMGITSENVAAKFNVTRKEQDQAALASHQKAAAAIKSGRFKDEIIPVETKVVDPKTGDETKIVVSVDDGVRADISLEGLLKLKPVFKKDGTTTAGNSSQVSFQDIIVLRELSILLWGRRNRGGRSHVINFYMDRF
jgi:acetyl-CoA acyltransferase 1